MRIKTILSEHRNDFTAVMECEHCGHTYVERAGYHDNNYHTRVIPALHCGACNKDRAGVSDEIERSAQATVKHTPATAPDNTATITT